MKFEEFGFKKEVLKQVKQIGFTETTLIQEKCIPPILKGRDVIGQSLTGSGKTAAFGLPIINQVEKGKNIQAIILTPTRELAEQVKEAINSFGRILGVRATSIYGGASFNYQVNSVKSAEIVVATPGRLIDHLDRRSFNLNNVRFVVLDEVDRMLDIGFEKDVNKILGQIPKERQTTMFSATMPVAAKKIAQKYLINPIHIQGDLKLDTSFLKQVAYKVPKERRFSLLLHLLKEKKGTAIVFCRTKRDVDKVAKNLRKNGLSVAGIHGDITQRQRQFAVNDLKENKLDALIATDVASRGLDIKNVTHVYNYEIPSESDDYTHRVGRTARAGKKGDAITFVTEQDTKLFYEIIKTNHIIIEELPEFENVAFFKTEQHGQFHSNERRGSFGRSSSNKRNEQRFGRKETSYGRKNENGFGKETSFGRNERSYGRRNPNNGRTERSFGKETSFGRRSDERTQRNPITHNSRNANFDYLSNETSKKQNSFTQNKQSFNKKPNFEKNDSNKTQKKFWQKKRSVRFKNTKKRY